MNARFYQPATGRFLSQDSYTGNPYEPWTQHLYSYVGNNPVNMVDPTGHFVIPLIMVGVAALLGYFGVATVATQQAGVVSSHNVTLPKINSPAENLLTIAVLATTLVLPFIHSDSKAQEKEKDVAKATDLYKTKGAQVVYRVSSVDETKVPPGRSWTPIKPTSVPSVYNYRDFAGLPSDLKKDGTGSGYYNTGEYLITGIMYNDKGVIKRPALPLDRNRGGLIEYYVPEPIDVSTRIVVISSEKLSKPY